MDGKLPFEIKKNSIAGIVLEVEKNDGVWLVVMPPGMDENVWKVKITDDTKIMKKTKGASIEDIKEGDHIIAIGIKNTDESTLEAELVDIIPHLNFIDESSE